METTPTTTNDDVVIHYIDIPVAVLTDIFCLILKNFFLNFICLITTSPTHPIFFQIDPDFSSSFLIITLLIILFGLGTQRHDETNPSLFCFFSNLVISLVSCVFITNWHIQNTLHHARHRDRCND